MCFGMCCWLPRAILPGTQSYDQGGGTLYTELSTDRDTEPESQDTRNSYNFTLFSIGPRYNLSLNLSIL